jgi:hypothetical protein
VETVSVVPGPQHRLGCVLQDGKRGVFLLRRDEPDVGIFTQDTITVSCAGGEESARRTYGMMLVAIGLALRNRWGMLFHGACLARGEQTVLIMGARGSCKTILALTLLRHGWDYLGDDKLLLMGGEAYLFESVLGIRAHHVLRLPWLAEHPGIVDGTGPAKFREVMAQAGPSILPKRYITSWERKWDERKAISVRELFPESNVLECATPASMVYLRPSDRTLAQSMEQGEALRTSLAVQHMMFQEMTPLEDLLVSYGSYTGPSLEKIIKRNLSGLDYHELQVANNPDPEDLARTFERCLKQA